MQLHVMRDFSPSKLFRFVFLEFLIIAAFRVLVITRYFVNLLLLIVVQTTYWPETWEVYRLGGRRRRGGVVIRSQLFHFRIALDSRNRIVFNPRHDGRGQCFDAHRFIHKGNPHRTRQIKEGDEG